MRIQRRVGWVLLAMLLSAGALDAQRGAQPAGAQGRGGRGQAAPVGPQLLHPMFQDHGVLQRDRPIKIYGETAPSAAVAVTLGTASVQARAGADQRQLFERAGVQEYWVIDPPGRTLAVYPRGPHGALEPSASLTGAESLTSSRLPGFFLPMAKLFG